MPGVLCLLLPQVVLTRAHHVRCDPHGLTSPRPHVPGPSLAAVDSQRVTARPGLSVTLARDAIDVTVDSSAAEKNIMCITRESESGAPRRSFMTLATISLP